MGKIKTVGRVTKRAAHKAVKGQLKYKGMGVTETSFKAVRYGVKFGPKAFIKRAKQEILSIDRRLGGNLYFPNGLVSGVNQIEILSWYKEYKRPVTVVIPSYNDLDVLIPCIKSIEQTTLPSMVKIIVVDDYCEPAHQKEMKKLETSQVRVILREKNGGFAKAVNTGLKAADPKLDVVLLNSDIIAHDDWLSALQYGAYEFGVDTGIVGPKLLYPDGRIQSGGSYRNTEAPEWFDHYYRFQDSNYGPANIPHYCIGVTGACMYVKRKFLNKVGILDEKFPFAKEDADWCLRGWEAGFRSLYFPSATLTHMEGASRAKNKTISVREKQSIKYFWEKWGDWFDKRNVKNSDGQIRIIFVLQTLGMSGGIRIVFEHANRLSEQGFAVEVWGLSMHHVTWEVSDKVKLRTFKNYEAMSKALEPEEAIKVATWWETAFPVWLASVRKGIPVYFIQEMETWFYPNDPIAQSTVVSCYRKEFQNMTTSKYNKSEIETLGLRATAIPCGYDDTTYRQLKDVKRETNVLLAVGRTFFQKNFEFTFKAWKALGEKRPKMWLFGYEPEMTKLDRSMRYITKPSNDVVNKLYNQATVFAQTSRHEGFSLPILEAMAAGCPVICTDAHGNRDFCVHNKNCIIVDHDDIAGLSAQLQRLFDDPSLRSKLSKAGLQTAKHYSWPTVMTKVENFYKDVAAQPRATYIQKTMRQLSTED